MTRRVVGARYGWGDWLAQRLSAVLMLALVAVFAAMLVAEAPVGYAAWSAFFDSSLLRVALFVFVLALAWHGFIGARDIVMDYIKVDWFRLLKHFGAFVYFVVCVAWAAKILL